MPALDILILMFIIGGLVAVRLKLCGSVKKIKDVFGFFFLFLFVCCFIDLSVKAKLHILSRLITLPLPAEG